MSEHGNSVSDANVTLHARLAYLDELEDLDEFSRAEIEEQLLSATPIFFFGRTALHLAAERGLGKVVAELLISCPSLIDARDLQGCNALHCAADMGQEEVVTQLLSLREVGTQLLSARSNDGSTALHYAASRGYGRVVAKLLAANPTLSDAVDNHGRTPLHNAAEAARDKITKQLLAVCDPATIDAVDNSGSLALHSAAIKGSLRVVKKILTLRPTSVLAVTPDGWTVLHFAVYFQHPKVLSRLLAAVAQQPEHERLLLQRSTQNDRVCQGSTVLHVAAQRGDDNVITQLLAACPALIDVVDVGHRTCAHCATNESILRKLLAFKPVLAHAVDAEGDTILHPLSCHPQVSRELIKHVLGMNPDAAQTANCDGRTPFHCAVAAGNEHIFDLLQWGLAFDVVMSAYEELGKTHVERFKPLINTQCEELAVVLIPDVAAIVFEYLGF